MDEYQLQTELTRDVKREIEISSEKAAIESDIQAQKTKIRREFIHGVASSGFFFLIMAITAFFTSSPINWFFLVIFGVVGLVYFPWLFYGLRKNRRKLEEWEKLRKTDEG